MNLKPDGTSSGTFVRVLNPDGTIKEATGGGGGLSTASNGLTAVVTDVQLGGTLTQDTTINGGSSFYFSLNNIYQFIISNAGAIFLDANATSIQTNGNFKLTNLVHDSAQDVLLGQENLTAKVGYITIGTGLSLVAGELSATGGGTGTVTSVASGNGMNFSTITSTGTVTLGTPSPTTLVSTDALTTNSHTHSFAPGGTSGQVILGDGTLGTLPTGTVTSVGLSVTSPGSPAFSVSSSPVTTSGTIALNVLGSSSQYIRGDGSLATTATTLPISSLTTATGNNTLDLAAFRQLWTVSGTGNILGALSITSTSTALQQNNKAIYIDYSGANAASNVTTWGQWIKIANTGTNSVNVGFISQASGGTDNTGIYGLGTQVGVRGEADITGIAGWFGKGRIVTGNPTSNNGRIDFKGVTSGTITMTTADAAGTYNFNLPTTAGTSGYILTSAGGAGSPMTWTDPASITPSGAALTKTDDTNVTLTLGGTPTTALLQATSLTLGWTGTLADGRIASASTWNAKQDALVSGTNIKTINGSSVLGSGNLVISTGVAWGAITGTLSSQTDLQTALDGKVDENVAITGATKTKITYDTKGLITSGADATTADIADSTNKRYVTDAQLVVIGNTSGTNTGDQTSVSGSAGSVVNALTIGAELISGGASSYNGSVAKTLGIQATSITNAMLAGSIASSKLVGTDIATVGTITSGTWNGTLINYAYLGTGGGGSTKFLREDNTWQTVSGAGDMILASVQTVTGLKTFDKDKLATKGTSTGVVTISNALTTGTSRTFTLPDVDITAAQLTKLTTSTSAATASTIVERDSNANITVNNTLGGYTTTATAAGTTTLTVGSTYDQFFTGATTQTVVLPDATTLALGTVYHIVNNSTGIVTVNKNGATLVVAMDPSTDLYVQVTNIGSAAGTWSSSYSGNIQIGGSKALASDFTTSSTAAGGVATNLTFAVLANEIYDVTVDGTCSKATSATGLKLAINGPSGATIKGEQYGGGATLAAALVPSLITTLATLGTTMATGTAIQVGFRLTFRIKISSTAGNVTLNAATVTSNVATIYAGTRMTWTRATEV